jgi:purine-binding chemotaxis protein CheW
MNEPFIIFQVAGASYAIRSSHVQQLEMIDNLTHVPNAPAFLDGVVYVRGEVIPVVNLRARFGFSRVDYDLKARLIVVRLGKRVVGLAVDSSREFVQLDAEDLLPPPEGLEGPNLDYLEGVIKHQDRLILVVDLSELLALEEKETLNRSLNQAELLAEQNLQPQTTQQKPMQGR